MSKSLSTDGVCGTNGAFAHIHSLYRPAHGYVSLVVCTFGCVANLLNIVVLTRREMSSPTNAILTGLAVADLLVMLEYIPFAWHIYLGPLKVTDHTYSWGWFVFAHSYITQVFHTISIWLTVTLAVWRYIAVAYPQRNREWCGMRRTVFAIAFGYVICPILNIPILLAFDILPKIITVNSVDAATNISSEQNVTIYLVDVSALGTANNFRLMDINFWVYSVVIKLIPCIALTGLSGGLICALMEAKRRRDALTSGSRKSPRNLENERQTDRTTKMLLAVLLLFLITELPQGILGLFSIFLGKKFFDGCYSKLGDTMDILALINSAINFMIYCAMSRQFRTTFSHLFRPRWLPVPQVDNGVNHNHTTTMVTQV